MERVVSPLAEAGVDLVVAADCCYIDQVQRSCHGTLHLSAEGGPGAQAMSASPGVVLTSFGTGPPLQDGKSPSTPAFVQTCAGLCGPNTRCLVAFERRAPEVGRGLRWRRRSSLMPPWQPDDISRAFACPWPSAGAHVPA